LVSQNLIEDKLLNKNLGENLKIFFTVKDEDYFQEDETIALLISHFGNDKIARLNNKLLALRAAGACLKYLNETQKATLPHINSISYYETCDYMVLDYSCRKNLEITESYMTGKKQEAFCGC